jgi:hypothetical protein
MHAQSSALFVLTGVLGCAAPQNPPEAAPAPAAPALAPAPPAAAPSAPSAVASTEEKPAALRAASDGGIAPSASQRGTACAPDTIRRTLAEVVAHCRRDAAALCGEIKVRASADGKSVQVSLDIAKDSFDDSFSRCVTSRLDAVAWACTLPGSDTTFDLGCEF